MKKDYFQKLFDKICSWYRLKRIIAKILSWRYKKRIDVELLAKAELVIVRLVQKREFINNQTTIKEKRKTLARMDPFVDKDDVLRVGGRISNSSSLPWQLKHPIILPKKHRVSILIIQHFYKKTQHGGRDATLNEIHQNGFMIREFKHRKLGEQKMADLPS